MSAPLPPKEGYYIDSAIEFLDEGNLTKAETLLNEGLKKNSKSTKLMLALANYYINLNQLKKAHYHINRLLSFQPNNPQAISAKAYILYKNSQPVEAESLANKALNMDRKNARAYLVLGRIAYDNAQQAKSDLTAQLFYREAANYFTLSAGYDFSMPDAFIGLAKVYAAEGQDKDAYQQLLIARELGTYNPETLYLMGELLYENQDYEKAIKFLNKSIEYSKVNNEKVHEYLAKIYEKLGDSENADKEQAKASNIKNISDKTKNPFEKFK